MRPEWKRPPKGWSKGKLVECAYVAITLAALNVHFAARGNRIDSPVQIWHRRQVKEGGKGEGAQERVQISSGRVPPSASSDAWRDVTDPIYAHWNNPIPSIPPPPPSASVVPPRYSRGPRRSRRDSPSVIYFHLFRPSNPRTYILRPHRALLWGQRISQYILLYRSKWFCIVAEPASWITLCTATGS